ncbi:hypothetical protein [Celerinatantimonas sp. MCCC 1A17872]|uniref:hypothetical protein n=1 Tax=Celerinatantimonas sp. MCCC 1A17872 TaxID=3177514 RepID=UPI0038C8BC95
MIDIEQPESDKIIHGCRIIDELLKTFEQITSLDSQALQRLHQTNKQKLGMLSLYADAVLTEHKKAQANRNIMLLYKPLTGQVTVTKEDFPKIQELLEQLSHECFCCWCI